MSLRRQVMEVLQGVFGFGKVAKSSGHGSYDVDGEIGEATTPDCERWGDAAVLSRPQVGAEVKYIQLGDERVVIGTRDTRWQIDVAAGEVVVRAMGAGSPAYVRLRPNGDVQIVGGNIHLGAESVATYVALANLVTAQLSVLKGAISGAAVTAGDGGTAFKANIVAALSAWPGTVAASKTRAQ